MTVLSICASKQITKMFSKKLKQSDEKIDINSKIEIEWFNYGHSKLFFFAKLKFNGLRFLQPENLRVMQINHFFHNHCIQKDKK